MIKKVLLMFMATAVLWLTNITAQIQPPPFDQSSLSNEEQPITSTQDNVNTNALEQESAPEEIADVLEAIDGIDLSALNGIDNPTPNSTPAPQPSIWDKLNLLKLYLLVELDVAQEKIKQHYNDNKKVYWATAGAASTVAFAYLIYYLCHLSQPPPTP